MKFIKKIRDDRKGLAIELAMMVMVATFAVSILLTTVALLQVDHSSSNMQDVKRRYELEQIGADYIAWVTAGAEGVFRDVPAGFIYEYVIPEVPVVEKDTSTSTDNTTDNTQEGKSEEVDDNKSSESENSGVTPSDAEANDDVSPDDNAPQQGGDANADNAEGSGGDVGGEGDDTTGETESVLKDAITPGRYTLTVKDENNNVVFRVVLEVSKTKKIDNTPGNKVKIITWELN